MWLQTISPLGSIWFSALAAVFPILLLFYLLAIRKWKGYQAGLFAVFVALLIVILIYKMPIKLALLTSLYGALEGLFPIGWIVLAAVFLYNLTVKSGLFDVVRDSIALVTEDRRLQALLIAFCFGAFLEGSAGFGAPVAITAGLLVGLGFEPLYAAGLCLVSNTAPVAFGGIGIAIVTAGNVSKIDQNILSKMIAHQLPLLAFIVPFWLVAIMSGWKGIKQIWPAILVTSTSYSVTMFLTASYLGPYLPDILSSVVTIIVLVTFLRYWKPKEVWRFPNEPAPTHNHQVHSWMDQLRAWMPFGLLIIFVGAWGIGSFAHLLDKYTTFNLSFAGLNKMILVGNKPMEVIYKLNWLSAAGTAILLAAIVAALVLRIKFKVVGEAVLGTLKELALPMLTIASVLSFAYIINYSGMAATMGKALTSTGKFFPFLSPFLGWLGVFITGSDTSSNALFCNMQKLTAQQINVNPVLTVAANSSGGVAAKMISPQNIAVGCGATGLEGKEGDLFRFAFKHSLAFVFIIGVITFLQAYFLKGMVPHI